MILERRELRRYNFLEFHLPADVREIKTGKRCVMCFYILKNVTCKNYFEKYSVFVAANNIFGNKSKLVDRKIDGRGEKLKW